MSRPFWEVLSLEQMSSEQWESLCDGCGRCCLVKLEDAEDGDIYFTDVACPLLDRQTCRCQDYTHRTALMGDCLRLTPETLAKINWLPPTCAYQRLREGRPLASWHPLVSGDADSVHQAGISVRGWAIAQSQVDEEGLQEHLISWVD